MKQAFPISVFTFIICLLLTTRHAIGMEEIVVAADYWPPFRIQTKYGIVGIDKDFLTLLGHRMNVKFTFRKMPWARCMLEMENGTVDVMTGLAKTPERTEFINYTSTPYYTCAPAFFARKDFNGKSVKSYRDLQGLLIGYTRDSVYFEPFDSDKQLNKIAGNHEFQLIQMVKNGRWDALIGTDCQVEYDLMKLNLTEEIIKLPYRPDKRINLYLGVSKKSPLAKRLEVLNKNIKELVESGAIKKSADRYLKRHEATRHGLTN